MLHSKVVSSQFGAFQANVPPRLLNSTNARLRKSVARCNQPHTQPTTLNREAAVGHQSTVPYGELLEEQEKLTELARLCLNHIGEPAAALEHLASLACSPHESQEVAPTKDLWAAFQGASEPYLSALPSSVLVGILMNCKPAGAPNPRWLKACLDALLTQLESLTSPAVPCGENDVECDLAASTAVEIGIALHLAPWQKKAVSTEVDALWSQSPALQLLPSVLAHITGWDAHEKVKPLMLRGMAALYTHVPHMQHQDISHLVHVLVALHERRKLAGADASAASNCWPALSKGASDGEQGLQLALLNRAQQIAWPLEQLHHLVSVCIGLSTLGIPQQETSDWLASWVRKMDQAELKNTLSIKQLLDLAPVVQPSAAACSPAGQGMTRQGDSWLMWWYLSTAKQMIAQHTQTLSTADLLQAAKVLAAGPASIDELLTASTMAPDGSHAFQARGSAGGTALKELTYRMSLMPAADLMELAVLLPEADLPKPLLHQVFVATIDRLSSVKSDLEPSSAVPVILAMSSAYTLNGPGRADATLKFQMSSLLDVLLEHSRPLLAACQTPHLLQLASGLAVMRHRPSIEWQAMFFCILKSRLSLLQANDLSCVLGAVATLGMSPDETWINTVFTTSRKLLDDMQPGQIADLVWNLGEQAPCMDWLWAPAYERASAPGLAKLNPTQLAGTIKALTALSYRPTQGWMDQFLEAVKSQLFAPGAVQMCQLWQSPEEPIVAESVEQHMAARAAEWSTYCAHQAATGGMSAAAPGNSSQDQGSVSVDSLMAIVDSLTYTQTQPRMDWMHDFTDAVRCKLSLLDYHQLTALVMYLVSTAFRPSSDWWDDYLDVVRSQLRHMPINDLATHLALLNTLNVKPDPTWLASWCASTQERLCLFMPGQLHQVLSCLAACGYTPPLAWLNNCSVAVEHLGVLFDPAELIRSVVILDRMGQGPNRALLDVVYSQLGVLGLQASDPAVLAQLAWTLQGVAHPPTEAWVAQYVQAAQAALPRFTQPQLESLLVGLHAISASSRRQGTGSPSYAAIGAVEVNASANVSSFMLMAREWMV